MKHIKLSLILVGMLALLTTAGNAQQYTGISGFLHIPSAEMNHEGDAHIGAHFLNKAMTPDTGFLFGGEKYHTFDYYLSVVPYSWLELGYTCTKRKITRPLSGDTVYGAKDRYFSVKIRPLSEGRYHPAIAIGCNDLGTTAFRKNQTDVQLYFTNVYVAATKHLRFGGNELGVNVAWRHYFRQYNDKWGGLVGGISFRPVFFPQGRAIVEYTGNEVLLGADALLWQHLLMQLSLKSVKSTTSDQGSKILLYANFGLCLKLNMLGRKYTY